MAKAVYNLGSILREIQLIILNLQILKISFHVSQ